MVQVLLPERGVLVDRDQLDATDVVFEEEHNRVIATEWRLKGEAEVVRRDVWVNSLCGLGMGAAQGSFG